MAEQQTWSVCHLQRTRKAPRFDALDGNALQSCGLLACWHMPWADHAPSIRRMLGARASTTPFNAWLAEPGPPRERETG